MQGGGRGMRYDKGRGVRYDRGGREIRRDRGGCWGEYDMTGG